jgi:hypothetical protein
MRRLYCVPILAAQTNEARDLRVDAGLPDNKPTTRSDGFYFCLHQYGAEVKSIALQRREF